ncbi:MAG: ABC transporter ATP-binding protein [Bacteroidota bacterium]
MSIRVDNFSFGYTPDEVILRNISFNVKKNSSIAIVGSSGCGKSTLLRLISGILKRSRNNIYDGKISVDGFDPEVYVKKGKIGFMFQEPTLFPNLSVKKNILIPLKFLKKKQYKEVNEFIEAVGLTKYVDYLPSQLSGGMKSRVALARTFVSKPAVLLLDEPFSSLDVKWKYLLYEELQRLKELYSATTIMVTHDIREALFLSNHVIVLSSNGEILKNINISNKIDNTKDRLNQLHYEYDLIHQLLMAN